MRDVAAHASHLDDASYRVLLDKALPRLIAAAGNAAEHRRSAFMLLTPHHAPEHFFDIYGRALSKINAPEPLLVALDHWLPLSGPDEPDPDFAPAHLARWREPAIEDCIEAARHLSKDAWEHLRGVLRERVIASEGHLGNEWRALLDRIALARRTRLEKVADRLHSIRNLVPGLSRRGAK